MFFFALYYFSFQLNSETNADKKYFDQYIDHNDKTKGTFKQLYYEILDNVIGQPKAVILKIGSESSKLAPGGKDDFIQVLAKKFNATCLTLQHRFFGESFPFSDTSYESLSLLNVDQAIEDLAEFRTFYATSKKLDVPWLLVGGSYPGLLSAYTRKIHPELFQAAISSSGVVQAINNFTDFDLQDAISMGQECASVVRQTRFKIDHLMVTDKDYLLNLFNATSLSSEPELFGNFIGELFTLSLQYGHLSELCGPLVDAHYLGQDTVMALAKYTKGFFAQNYGFAESYSTDFMKKPIIGAESNARCWFWMTCNEVAYWQIYAGRLSLRSPAVTQEAFENQCQRVFGHEMHPNVDEFNKKYGGLGVETTNVYFTTSSQDPWTWACVTEDSGVSKGNYAHTIIGKEMGHCSDLHKPSDNDAPDLVRTRAHMIQVIERWLFPVTY